MTKKPVPVPRSLTTSSTTVPVMRSSREPGAGGGTREPDWSGRPAAGRGRGGDARCLPARRAMRRGRDLGTQAVAVRGQRAAACEQRCQRGLRLRQFGGGLVQRLAGGAEGALRRGAERAGGGGFALARVLGLERLPAGRLLAGGEAAMRCLRACISSARAVMAACTPSSSSCLARALALDRPWRDPRRGIHPPAAPAHRRALRVEGPWPGRARAPPAGPGRWPSAGPRRAGAPGRLRRSPTAGRWRSRPRAHAAQARDAVLGKQLLARARGGLGPCALRRQESAERSSRVAPWAGAALKVCWR